VTIFWTVVITLVVVIVLCVVFGAMGHSHEMDIQNQMYHLSTENEALRRLQHQPRPSLGQPWMTDRAGVKVYMNPPADWDEQHPPPKDDMTDTEFWERRWLGKPMEDRDRVHYESIERRQSEGD